MIQPNYDLRFGLITDFRRIANHAGMHCVLRKPPHDSRCHIASRLQLCLAAGIYGFRRLKIKHCAEPVGEARSVLRLKIKHCAEPVGEARSVLDFCLSITPNVHPCFFSTHFITQNVQVTPK